MQQKESNLVKVNRTEAFACNHCNRNFTSKTQLDHHIKYATSNRAFACPVKDCGSIFIAKSHVSEHMTLHYGNRPHACTFPGCSYRGKTSSQLAQHRATHGFGYVYACDYCDYRATTSSNLRRHARLHLATRPYRCPHCPQTFVELSALRRHVLDSAYHPGLPLYVCPWCGVSGDDLSVRQSTSAPTSLIIDSPIQTPGAYGFCGFNSSNLAWKHVVEAHADRLSAPETLIRIGRKPGEILIEHDVTIIFGLYNPSEDGKFRPSSAVRQINHLLPSPKPRQRVRFGSGPRTLRNPIPFPPNSIPSDHPHEDHVVVEGGDEVLQFTQQDGAVVALPGGVLWSSPAFQSELVRITGGSIVFPNSPHEPN